MEKGIQEKSLMRSCVNAPLRLCRSPHRHLLADACAFALVYALLGFLPSSTAADGPAAKNPVTKAAVIRKQVNASQDMPAGSVLASFSVEVVAENADRQKGLSERDYLPPDSGMLFVLDQVYAPAFSMKDMRFPIDIIFFDRHGKALKIMKLLQPCTQCRIYEGPRDSAYALEINAGLAEKIGISIGDSLSLEE